MPPTVMSPTPAPSSTPGRGLASASPADAMAGKATAPSTTTGVVRKDDGAQPDSQAPRAVSASAESDPMAISHEASAKSAPGTPSAESTAVKTGSSEPTSAKESAGANMSKDVVDLDAAKTTSAPTTQTTKSTSSSAPPQTCTSPTSSMIAKGKGGRKAANPHLSDDERRRERVLKNRESAMKSLQKKKRYTEELETRAAMLHDRNADLKVKIRQLLSRLSLSSRHDYLASLPPLPTDLLSAIPPALLQRHQHLAYNHPSMQHHLQAQTHAAGQYGGHPHSMYAQQPQQTTLPMQQPHAAVHPTQQMQYGPGRPAYPDAMPGTSSHPMALPQARVGGAGTHMPGMTPAQAHAMPPVAVSPPATAADVHALHAHARHPQSPPHALSALSPGPVDAQPQGMVGLPPSLSPGAQLLAPPPHSQAHVSTGDTRQDAAMSATAAAAALHDVLIASITSPTTSTIASPPNGTPGDPAHHEATHAPPSSMAAPSTLSVPSAMLAPGVVATAMDALPASLSDAGGIGALGPPTSPPPTCAPFDAAAGMVDDAVASHQPRLSLHAQQAAPPDATTDALHASQPDQLSHAPQHTFSDPLLAGLSDESDLASMLPFVQGAMSGVTAPSLEQTPGF